MYLYYTYNIAKTLKKNIDFSDRAVKLVEFIREQGGHKTFSATLHAIIAELYEKKYFSKKYGSGESAVDTPEADPILALTAGQMCEQVGGKWDANLGTCAIRKSANDPQNPSWGFTSTDKIPTDPKEAKKKITDMLLKLGLPVPW